MPVAFFVLACTRPSAALARAVEREPDPAPEAPRLVLEGDLVVERLEAHVACGSFDFIEVFAECRVTLLATVVFPRGGALALSEGVGEGDAILVSGVPLAARHALAPGQRAEVFLRAERHLRASPDVEDDPYVLSATFTRHPLAGEHRSLGVASAAVDLDPFRSATLSGPVVVDGTSRGIVEVSLGDAAVSGRLVTGAMGTPVLPLRLRLSRDRTHVGLLANGGLVLTVGSMRGIDDGAERPVAWLGYELVLDDFVFVSASLGTDGDSMYEAVVAEVASPDLLYLIPSFSVGVGVVARQLTAEADAALRLRVSAQLPMLLGVVVDLDHWPLSRTTTVTVSGRASF